VLNRNVLVLNQNYEPLSITRAKRAIILIYLGKAEIVERYRDLCVRSASKSLPIPSIVRLIFFVKVRRRTLSLSRRNIIKRDNHRCQYCGATQGGMTTDHVIPKKLGGKDSWENLVCACVRCNNRKGNRIPEDAGMGLLRQPKRPHFFTFVHGFISIPDDRWKQYLFLDN